jgi:hypothetical protein
MGQYNTTVFNDYTIKPRNISEFTSFRGVVDFSQIGKFNQYETGYSYLEVLEMPKYLTMLRDDDPNGYGLIYDSFKTMLEYEFRGLTGLPDTDSESYTITDGINEQQLINKVTMQTSIEVSMNYYERQGGLITKFAEHYLTGIKDKMTQAKSYHGLIKNGKMNPSPENEVFTLLYIVTDNTMLRVEKAVLLANAQLTRAETSMYDTTRGDISNVEKTISFRCFPITGNIVDAAAKAVVEDISGVKVGNPTNLVDTTEGRITGPISDMSGKAVLDSTNYKYGVIGPNSDVGNQAINEIIRNTASSEEFSDSRQQNH